MKNLAISFVLVLNLALVGCAGTNNQEVHSYLSNGGLPIEQSGK